MSEQYDELALRYPDVEDVISAYRDRTLIPSLRRVLGDIRGARALDVGCGSGEYSRILKRLGASHVVGFDESFGMVERAQETEARDPLGIEYHVYDAAVMPTLGVFDVAIAVNVLHYASTRHVLTGMCERIHANLAPGGRLAVVHGTPGPGGSTVAPNGFVIQNPAGLGEGETYTISIPTTPPATLQVYYWTTETLTEVLTSVGFTDIVMEPLVDQDTSHGDVRSIVVEGPVMLLVSAVRSA